MQQGLEPDSSVSGAGGFYFPALAEKSELWKHDHEANVRQVTAMWFLAKLFLTFWLHLSNRPLSKKSATSRPT